MKEKTITFTAPMAIPGIGGKTFTNGRIITLKGELMIDFGYQDFPDGRKSLLVRAINYPEILEQLKAIEAEKADRQRKIDEIEGLIELRAACLAWEEYQCQFETMMEDENNDGVSPPKLPSSDPEKLAEKYPRAALFLKAESYTLASHHLKITAGESAIDKILDGAPIEEIEDALNWTKSIDLD